MKELDLEQMEKVEGGWELVCDIDWGHTFRWAWEDDWFYGYFEVSNCYFL